eukprot:392658-Rhodomonas_salina.1
MSSVSRPRVVSQECQRKVVLRRRSSDGSESVHRARRAVGRTRFLVVCHLAEVADGAWPTQDRRASAELNADMLELRVCEERGRDRTQARTAIKDVS